MKKVLIAIILIALVIGGYFYFKKQPNLESKNIAAAGEKIPVIIVPHFNTFADKRAELLKNLESKYQSKTTVVVSVNHFNSGSSSIITAEKEWKFEGGNVKSDANLTAKLASSSIATSDESAFANEHGIANIVPDIITSKAGILPIIIKDTTPRSEIDKLADWLNSNCQDCLMIASVDFSHYCPRALAKVHDSYSIQALANLDKDKTWIAETDSPQVLYLAESIAEKNQAKNFHLFYNANSGDASGNDDAEVTSVVLGYYSNTPLSDSEKIEPPKGAPSGPSSSFVIAGDAMFDRNVWHNYKDIGLKKIFDNFGTRVFRGSDLALLNLEGPISATPIDDDWKSGSMVFNFPLETPLILKYLNVGAVSLANNHTANAGATGLANTRKVLGDAGIKSFGQPEGFSDVSVLQIDGEIPVTIIGIMALSDFDHNTMNSKIKEEKSAGRTVIIFPHWGEEYKASHVASQKSLAKEWVAAGADAIIGSHPHVTEDFEIIDGKPVVYSLGNFVFDQFFSQETQEGLIVAGIITKDKITLSFLPTREKAVKPEFMTGSEKTAKIKQIIDIDSQTGFKKISSDTIETAR